MLDFSLNELNQIASTENYKPVKTKSILNDNYIEYESKRDKDKNLSPKEYFDAIKPYSSSIINNHKSQFGEWKIQLTMKINFISPEETCTMHTKSDKIKVMMGSETNDNIEQRLKKSMIGSEFIRDSADLL